MYNCRCVPPSTKYKETSDRRHIKNIIFEYSRIGDISKLSIFNRIIYMRIGSVRSIFEIIINDDNSNYW